MLFNPEDIFIGGSLARYGEFSEQEVQALLALAPQGGVVLDIGANIGCLTVPLAKKSAFVVAVEPQRVTFQHLCANVALSRLRNVITLHAAMSDHDGIMRIVQPDWDARHNNGGFSLNQAENGEPTRVLTIDGLKLPKCDLIKIDVEGWEGVVIKGGLETIKKFKPALYVEADRNDKAAALIEQIMSLGYKCWWHLPPLFNPDNFHGNAENAFPNIVSINLLCLAGDPPDLQLYEAQPGDTFPILMGRLAG